MSETAELDKVFEMWRLPELAEAIICLNMPLAWTDEGDPVYGDSDLKTLSTGLTAANTRIVELEAELAELEDVIADLTAELERRTAGLGEMPF